MPPKLAKLLAKLAQLAQLEQLEQQLAQPPPWLTAGCFRTEFCHPHTASGISVRVAPGPGIPPLPFSPPPLNFPMAIVNTLDGRYYDLDPEFLESCRIPDDALEAHNLPSLPEAPPTQPPFTQGPHPWIRVGPGPNGGPLIQIGPPPFVKNSGPEPQIFLQGHPMNGPATKPGSRSKPQSK